MFPGQSSAVETFSQFNSTGTVVRNACKAMTKAAQAVDHNIHYHLTSIEQQALFNNDANLQSLNSQPGMFGGHAQSNNFGGTSAFGSQDFGNETLKMVNFNEAHY